MLLCGRHFNPVKKSDDENTQTEERFFQCSVCLRVCVKQQKTLEFSIGYFLQREEKKNKKQKQTDK